MLRLTVGIILLTSLFLVIDADESTTDYFVYAKASSNLVENARQIGRTERRRYDEILASKEHTVEERMDLYATHVLKCSKIDKTAALSNQLDSTVGESTVTTSETAQRAQDILQVIGFEPETTSLFTKPSSQILNTIQKTCLKNELHFQCAFGFLGDMDQIRENVEEMKKNDGNVKIMFEQECSNDESEIPRLYSCFGDAAEEVHAACGASLTVLNRTRHQINTRIDAVYRQTLKEIDRDLEGSEPERTIAEANEKLRATLVEIRRLEAFRCRMYTRTEVCAVDVLTEMCGEKAKPIAQTLLRIGHLKRERGDDLNDQFETHKVKEHRTCSELA
ncbi:hypothetical protein M3Y94_00574100 [Aphelenchoides besseyi]|nr:hypothetical protein M3Y94_00574100 [Aphelenchoides besseyi]KAI6218066.1 hypothetical protein M3Y95_01180700 [Aphelenchoides besseyi]